MPNQISEQQMSIAREWEWQSHLDSDSLGSKYRTSKFEHMAFNVYTQIGRKFPPEIFLIYFSFCICKGARYPNIHSDIIAIRML